MCVCVWGGGGGGGQGKGGESVHRLALFLGFKILNIIIFGVWGEHGKSDYFGGHWPFADLYF